MSASDYVRPLPLGLIEGFAKVWVGLSGGSYRLESIDGGTLVWWRQDNGTEIGLPDRMYGLAGYESSDFSKSLPPGTTLNLPPGVQTAVGAIHCETHVLNARTKDDAWASLKRVGRQGVRKAETTNCQVEELRAADYLTLSRSKNDRLGSPPTPDQLLTLMSGAFGDDNVGLTGVQYGKKAIAAVLWILVDGYGLLVDGASDPNHWDKNPNNLAVWASIEQLLSRGADVIDFGFSPVGAGDARFKKHMGGTPVPLFQVTQ